MNYDITYCSNVFCKNRECERNQYNIKDLTRNVWIGNFENCEYWEDKQC